jgi:hypothetical protein
MNLPRMAEARDLDDRRQLGIDKRDNCCQLLISRVTGQVDSRGFPDGR